MSFLHLNFILVIAQLNEYSRSTVSENRAFGFPRTVSAGGLGIDIDKDFYSVSPIDGDRQKVKQFFMNNGIIGSYLEGGIFEQIFGGEAVSTIHILNAANKQGVKIYRINSENITAILPKLEYDTAKKQMLQNYINCGKEVIVPEKAITISGWSGTGYIILDPEDGSGAYMIDGGLAGGVWIELASVLISIILATLILALIGTPLTLAAIPYLMYTFLGLVLSMVITVFLPESWQSYIYNDVVPLVAGVIGLIASFLSGGAALGLAMGIIGVIYGIKALIKNMPISQLREVLKRKYCFISFEMFYPKFSKMLC